MNEYLSLTELGRIYGVSSHQAGKRLKGLGLRNESGQPTIQAFNEGYVRQATSTQPGTFFYIWNAKKVTELFDGMSYPRAIPDSGQREHRAGDS